MEPSSNWAQGHDRIDQCLNHFIAFLTGCKPPPEFTHVVFRGGTVVRLDSSEDVSLFKDFDATKYKQGYPMHRLVSPDQFEEFLVQNQTDLDWALDKCTTDQQKAAIRKAYYVLIQDGYPFPGGEGADTSTIPINDTGSACMTIFIHRHPRLLTITSVNEASITEELSVQQIIGSHDTLGREHRRLDFMFPRIYAIIEGLTATVFK